MSCVWPVNWVPARLAITFRRTRKALLRELLDVLDPAAAAARHDAAKPAPETAPATVAEDLAGNASAAEVQVQVDSAAGVGDSKGPAQGEAVDHVTDRTRTGSSLQLWVEWSGHVSHLSPWLCHTRR